MRRFSLAIAASSLIVGCAPSDTDPGPGGVSVGEAKALDEAAEMIEQRRLPEDAVLGAEDTDAPLPPDSEPAAPTDAPPQAEN